MNTFEYNYIGLGKAYSGKSVIHDARIKVFSGQCSVLIGDNGAGKSTLLKMMSGLEKADSGQFMINKNYCSWRSAKKILLKQVMYLHQQPYMLDGSVKKNLEYLCKMNNQPLALLEEAIEWADLNHISDQQAKNLSGGEKQRVALARAYLRNPQLILLDEPTANLDQQSKFRTLELLKQFKSRGIAMVIASHDPQFFQGIQDECLQLSQGKLTNSIPRNTSKQMSEINRFMSKQA